MDYYKLIKEMDYTADHQHRPPQKDFTCKTVNTDKDRDTFSKMLRKQKIAEIERTKEHLNGKQPLKIIK